MRTDKHRTAQQRADSMAFQEALMSTMLSKALKRMQWGRADWGRR